MATQKQLLDAAVEAWNIRQPARTEDYIRAREAMNAWIDQVAASSRSEVSQERIAAVKRTAWRLLSGGALPGTIAMRDYAADFKALLRA